MGHGTGSVDDGARTEGRHKSQGAAWYHEVSFSRFWPGATGVRRADRASLSGSSGTPRYLARLPRVSVNQCKLLIPRMTFWAMQALTLEFLDESHSRLQGQPLLSVNTATLLYPSQVSFHLWANNCKFFFRSDDGRMDNL